MPWITTPAAPACMCVWVTHACAFGLLMRARVDYSCMCVWVTHVCACGLLLMHVRVGYSCMLMWVTHACACGLLMRACVCYSCMCVWVAHACVCMYALVAPAAAAIRMLLHPVPLPWLLTNHSLHPARAMAAHQATTQYVGYRPHHATFI